MVNYMLRVNLNIALIEMNNSNNSMGPFVNWTGNINIQICYDQKPKLLNFRAESMFLPLDGLI